MYKLLMITLLAVVGRITTDAESVARFEWNQTTIDLGEISKGSKEEVVFTFTNAGNVPLQITEVKASCGCTVADYPKQAIGIGEEAAIKVSYVASSSGAFNKTVRIQSNAEEEWVKLTVKGIVVDLTGE